MSARAAAVQTIRAGHEWRARKMLNRESGAHEKNTSTIKPSKASGKLPTQDLTPDNLTPDT
jgi:hypothetical protein